MAKLELDLDKVREVHGDDFADWLINVQNTLDNLMSDNTVKAISRPFMNGINVQKPGGSPNVVVKPVPQVGERWTCPSSPKRSGTVVDVKNIPTPYGGETRITIDHDIPGKTTYTLEQLHQNFELENKLTPGYAQLNSKGQIAGAVPSAPVPTLDEMRKAAEDIGMVEKQKDCECGVDSIGGGIHSSWCPKG